MGADIPEVDTVLTTQKAVSNSNIDEAQKILQWARHTRCHPEKKDAKMILFNTKETRDALGLFVHTYDPDMTVTNIFRFQGGQILSFEEVVRASVPDQDLHREIGRIVEQLRIKSAPAPPLDVVFPSFLKRFAERKPSSGETFELDDPKLAPQDGVKWMTKIVNYLRGELDMLHETVRAQVNEIFWLTKKVLTPKTLKHLVQPPVKPQGYDEWLKRYAPNRRVSVDDIVSFCENVMNDGNKNDRINWATQLCSDETTYKFKLKDKLKKERVGAEADPHTSVELEKTHGGIWMNMDLFEVAAEINQKVAYNESGNGSLRSFAAKLIIYQLRQMPTSMYDDAWYEQRVADVQAYREIVKKRKDYETKYWATHKKRKSDFDAEQERAKHDRFWQTAGFARFDAESSHVS